MYPLLKVCEQFVSFFIRPEKGFELDVCQKEEATDGDENAIFPVQPLGREEPDVESEEESKRQTEQRIRKGKKGIVRKVNSEEHQDQLKHHNALQEEEVGLVQLHC